MKDGGDGYLYLEDGDIIEETDEVKSLRVKGYVSGNDYYKSFPNSKGYIGQKYNWNHSSRRRKISKSKKVIG